MDAVLLCSALFALRCSAFGLSALGPALCCNLPHIVASQVAFPSSNKRSDQRRAPGTISLCLSPSAPHVCQLAAAAARQNPLITGHSGQASARTCILVSIAAPVHHLTLLHSSSLRCPRSLRRSFRRRLLLPLPIRCRVLSSTLHPPAPLQCPPLSPAGVLRLLGLSAQPSIRSVSVALCCARQPKTAHLPRLPGQLPLFGRRCLTCPTIADAPPACARCITLVSAVHSALRPCEPATKSHQEVHTAAPPISRLAP